MGGTGSLGQATVESAGLSGGGDVTDEQPPVVRGAELEELGAVYADGSGRPVALRFDPSFDGKRHLSYAATVAGDVSVIGIDPLTLNPSCHVVAWLNGVETSAGDWDRFRLVEGSNTIELDVVASDGKQNKYRFKVKRGL